ncbi:dTDP-4-amino-4,6-dideoxygalactose transaminase [Herbiconiux sp. VKM Ac-1786]|uniref:dTDP-4-amino-4,6-dideoxygalactose transaminase n=1 Tax=Herbiconiux sp. VKM Ac-1786 TaxID=2783824 RepID=UPI00188AB6C2|nr:dTDP-4-amino-4,6-dideoxygalactose transaminase [Herbiconiux sp. VKM Ac-1786]MBF4574458.1 dTDP-4-amino-4,6-dideoxygalactose transaminase [Herbiconiux sp. VKM Ac-1786]
MPDEIVFSRPYRAPGELTNLAAVLDSDHSHGDGAFTASATGRLREVTGATDALLTTSCTHALEMSMLLLDVRPGDEVVLPSFTFTSAAIAVVARGATPVFVDIEGPSGNLDVGQVAEALTPRTKAVIAMHYGGASVDLDALLAATAEAGVALVEDNAHGLGGRSGAHRLGTVGVLGTQSFHDTKNVHCGEGGALLVNDPALWERAEVIREKGTNRARFLRGQVDKYTWQDEGSSYLPSELNAAVLDAQLAAFDEIQQRRLGVWTAYAEGLSEWAAHVGATLVSDTVGLEHSAHLFYAVMPDHEGQQGLIAHLREAGVRAAFHYVPLDSSPAGQRYGRTAHVLDRTAAFSAQLVRLPLWAGLADAQIERVIEGVTSYRPVRVA